MAGENAIHTSSRRDYLKLTAPVGGGLLAGCLGGGNGTESMTLKISNFMPEGTTLWADQVLPFKSKLQELTDREITFEEFPGGQLGGGGESYNLLQSETADLQYFSCSYFVERFPLSSIVELPGYPQDVQTKTEAYRSLAYQDPLEQEYKDANVMPIITVMSPNVQIGTAEGVDKISEPGDLDGMSIRSTGGILSVMIEQLGASPTQLSGEDIYPALDRGTIDAAATYINGMAMLNLSEVLGGVTQNGAFSAPTNNYWMRRDYFDSLDSDLQDAIREAGEYASSEGAAAMRDSVESHFQDFSDAGVDVYDLPSSMVEDYLSDKYQAVRNEWLDQIGGDAESMLSQWEDALQ